MFTAVREYRVDPQAVREIAHLADERFADRVAEMPGFVAYELIDCGDGRAITLTVFTDRDSAEATMDMAAEFLREELRDFDIERLDAKTGEVLVNRAASDVLEAVHA